ncbi:PP2C family protein-serine/threonine phosphatase [Streptomyces iconiensis]
MGVCDAIGPVQVQRKPVLMTSPRLPKVAGIQPAISPPSQTPPSASGAAPADRAPGSERAPEERGTDSDRISDLASLHELTTAVVRTEALDSALRETLRAGASLLGARRGLIALDPAAPGAGLGAGGAVGPASERTIGLGLERADLGQIETVPRSSAAYTRVLDCGAAGDGEGAGAAARPCEDPAEGIACPDIATDEDLAPRHREVAARIGYAASYAVPLTTDNGTRLGAAVWLYDEPTEPTARQRRLLGSYLRHATEHAARLGELARTRGEMATLREELLPSSLPRVAGVTLAVRHRTGPRGGGDWYDALPLPERALGLAVGGVTGSGPAVVAAMGRLRASLRAYAVMEGEDPVAVLSDLELLLRLTEPARSATALFAYAEPAGRKILLAGAGHCPPLIVGPRRVEPVETALSAPLGMLACWEAPSAEVTLSEGETLLCYTDGLLHRTGDSMDRAFARLRTAAAGAPRAAHEDPELLVEHVLRTVLPGPLADDRDHPEDVVVLAARF